MPQSHRLIGRLERSCLRNTGLETMMQPTSLPSSPCVFKWVPPHELGNKLTLGCPHGCGSCWDSHLQNKICQCTSQNRDSAPPCTRWVRTRRCCCAPPSHVIDMVFGEKRLRAKLNDFTTHALVPLAFVRNYRYRWFLGEACDSVVTSSVVFVAWYKIVSHPQLCYQYVMYSS